MNATRHVADQLARLTDPVDVLRAAADTFGDRIAIASSLGPQTLVVIDMLAKLGRPVPVFFLDTGLLFPETYDLRLRVQARYDLEIRSVTPRQSVDAQAAEHGPALWARDADACCKLRKVDPLRGALSGLDAWITGVRRDQSSTRGSTGLVEWDHRYGLVKVNPLADWNRARVFAYLHDNDVPYNPLLDEGYRSVGCAPCTRAVGADADPHDERAGRWAGSAKTECGMHYPEIVEPAGGAVAAG